jgi:hypothetical protein
MKLHELLGGLNLPVYAQEYALYEKIDENDGVEKSTLGERDQELLRNMYIRGILKKVKNEGKLLYRINKLEDQWRI